MATQDPAVPAPSPDEPSFAEQARTLVQRGRVGALSTHSRHQPGHPFGSLAPYGVDPAGGPTFLISRLAMHTQNLAADARASLLVAEPGGGDDPLAAARLTVLGDVAPVADAAAAALRADYLERHPEARRWADFGDFGLWRMRVAAVYLVGGFGSMAWVGVEEYAGAAPDPLAEAAAGIVEHMNADHADALVVYARFFGGVEAEEAAMTGVDRLGFRLRVRSGDSWQALRLRFPTDVRTTGEARTVLIDMLRRARSA